MKNTIRPISRMKNLTYNARDLAVARAKLQGAVCVLASATPSP